MTVPLKTKVANFRCTPERYKQIKEAMEQMPWIESFTDLVERSLQAFLNQHVPLNGDVSSIQEPEKHPGPAHFQPENGKPTSPRPRPAKTATARKPVVSKVQGRLKKLAKKLQRH